MTDDVTLTSRTEVYSDPYLRVVRKCFEHKGRDYAYFIKEEPEFAICGAITADGQVLMVRQFRPGPARWLYDMPGGMIDAGDTPLETARRELLEETGYMAELEHLTTCYVTAYSTAKKHIFLAKNCRKVAEPEEDTGVIAEPVLLNKEAFLKLVDGGELLDLECGLLLARHLSENMDDR
ncbi:NUDIX hydrolase [Kordiimonas aestuarii]|uniref:NUDIX hydrolase n=1 Tax=Kordiimonas aestuarii TaxID=1005925 RepID=UPI0021CE9A8A|nr:NUDIX hydrolase [Kordiimonas aestuarii]